MKHQGMTLVELVTTMGLVGILSVAAMPSYFNLVESSQATADVNKLLGAINYARSTAIQTAQITTLCPSADGQACSKNWSQGLLVFVDANGDGTRQSDDPGGSERVVYSFAQFKDGSTLDWRAFRRKPFLQFTPQGFTRAQNGTFTLCPPSKKLHYAKMVILNRSGRPRLAPDQDGDGIPDGANNKRPVCA